MRLLATITLNPERARNVKAFLGQPKRAPEGPPCWFQENEGVTLREIGHQPSACANYRFDLDAAFADSQRCFSSADLDFG